MTPVRAVVISLARRPDRLEAFHRRWAAATAGAPVDVFTAVDRPDRPVLGCYESHLTVLATAGPGPLLVLEDDAVFTPDFRLDLPEPPPGWWLLRLGGLTADTPMPARGLGVAAVGAAGGLQAVWGAWRRVQMLTQTHAYVARNPARLAAGISNRPVGNVSAALAFGWPGHYRLTPGTVEQPAGGDSDIGGRPAT